MLLNYLHIRVYQSLFEISFPQNITHILQIAFFYKDEENDYKHTFKSLNINSDGKMSSWPEGFFDEWEKALIELL